MTVVIGFDGVQACFFFFFAWEGLAIYRRTFDGHFFHSIMDQLLGVPHVLGLVKLRADAVSFRSSCPIFFFSFDPVTCGLTLPDAMDGVQPLSVMTNIHTRKDPQPPSRTTRLA